MNSVRLTSYSHGAGCACKLAAPELAQIIGPLRQHPSVSHPDLLVGLGTSDDAGVYRIAPDMALVQTVDFFTPIVDDPRTWGKIAAANALSDVYAMGGTPLTSLQLIGWPREGLDFDLARQVVDGGAEVMAAAGCVIVGGHSIDDAEPTYGFAVTGTVAPDRVITNAGARVGDALILTKPLGVGVATTAHKADRCPPGLLAEAVEVMTSLNDVAGSQLSAVGAHAATDVTGFGLVGHLSEMLDASGVGARLVARQVPLLDGALELAEDGLVPGGSRRNLEAVRERLSGDDRLWTLLADAQTSGGLLVSVLPDKTESYTEAVPGAVVVGEVTDHIGRIEVV